MSQHQKMLAHRYSWTIVNGPIPDGLVVCHKCDNPPCVNPAHLFLGTQADNSRDMWSKGRGRKIVPRIGEQAHKAKLTADDVRAIRAAHQTGVSMRQLARDYGVDKGAIQYVVYRKSWKHIP